MSGRAHVRERGLDAREGARVAALVRCFERIAHTSMAGLPMINANLSVEAVGFERVQGSVPEALTGILLTPWFMNLIWLPVEPDTGDRSASGSIERAVGGKQMFEFVPNVLDGIGRIESCSLFSPMNDFATLNDARDTAREILRTLRVGSLEAAGAAGVACGAARRELVPARRQFLFGRSRARA